MAKKRKGKRKSANPNVPAMEQAMRRMKPKMPGGTMMGPSGDITGTGATETPMRKKGKKKLGRR